MGSVDGGGVLAAYDGVICDLDGVLYRGGDPVPGASEALTAMAAAGIRVVYATNNASRVADDVAEQLVGLGAPVRPDDVVTSAQAGAEHLAHQLDAGARVMALGGPGVADALRRVGLCPVAPNGATSPATRAVTTSPDAASSAPPAGPTPAVATSPDAAHPQQGSPQPDGPAEAAEVEAVLQGLGRQLTVADFESAARQLARGTLWVATNTDSTLPLEWGIAPGNGAYVGLLAAASGRRPFVVGKPCPPLYRLATERLGTAPSRTLAIGDRLDTDIAGATETGIDSAWVLTGVDRPSARFAGTGPAAPTYIVASLGELFEPYVPAEPARPSAAPTASGEGPAGSRDGRDAARLGAGQTWRCGSATARVEAGELVLDPGHGRPVEAVRAGLAALLEATPAAGDSDAPHTLRGLTRDEARRLARALDALVA